MKKNFKILAIVAVIFVCVFIMSSCTKDKMTDGTLIYREVEGGYEVIGIADKNATDIKIPLLFRGKMVVSIGENVFYKNSIKA